MKSARRTLQCPVHLPGRPSSPQLAASRSLGPLPPVAPSNSGVRNRPASSSDCLWPPSPDPVQARIYQPPWLAHLTAYALPRQLSSYSPNREGNANTPTLAVDRTQNLRYPLQYWRALAALPTRRPRRNSELLDKPQPSVPAAVSKAPALAGAYNIDNT